MADRFYIGPYSSESGQDTSLKPFMIPDSAFERLDNAYVFRGRVRKRFGSKWLGDTQQSTRLRVSVGTLAAPSPATPSATGAQGQMFSVANVLFTVKDTGSATMLVANGSATTKTFNTANGQFTINGVNDSAGNAVNTATTIYWYPSLPVMGLISREQENINNEPTIAFDTQYSYQYVSPTGWERITGEAVAGDATWSGSNSQYFWGTNWQGADPSDLVLFVTNFNQNEARYMRYLLATTWTSFRPLVSAGVYLNAARILIVFKNRLLALNTYEGAGSPGLHYPFRCRYSGVGSPLATNAFNTSVPGNGNAIDAPTTEAIISAEFVKDRLIVFFERSTWEIVYTGNQIYPFQWQQINTELGAESTFSIVPFDKVALGVGNVGIHACNGANVERIDDKIPDAIFDIHNGDQGVERVYGIRDYTVEMVYWTFPGIDTSSDFPFSNRVLVYNYKTGTWAFNDDSITVFGYYQPTLGILWDSTIVIWDDDEMWGSGSGQAQYREVIAGNQEGWTFICDPEKSVNAPALQITNLVPSGDANNVLTITSYNHNLREGDYIMITGIPDISPPDPTTYNLTLLNYRIYQVNTVTDANVFKINFDDPDDQDIIIIGTYIGGGVIARVSNIRILTKQFNFYAKDGRNATVNKIDFLIDKTDVGETNVLFATNTSVDPTGNVGEMIPVLETFPYPTYYPYESEADQLWRSVYLDAQGEYIQILLEMGFDQMTDVTITEMDDGTSFVTGPALEDFEMHSMIITADKTGRLQ